MPVALGAITQFNGQWLVEIQGYKTEILAKVKLVSFIWRNSLESDHFKIIYFFQIPPIRVSMYSTQFEVLRRYAWLKPSKGASVQRGD